MTTIHIVAGIILAIILLRLSWIYGFEKGEVSAADDIRERDWEIGRLQAEVIKLKRTGAPSHGLTPAEAERLYMLGEESAEVIQAICKVLRHGYDSFNPDAPEKGNNREQLIAELADLTAMQRTVRFAPENLTPTLEAVDKADSRKRRYTLHQGDAQ